QGKIDEAVAEFRETLRLDPANAQALFSLCEMAAAGVLQLPPEQVQRLRDLAARADRPIDDLCKYNFALALLDDRAGAYDRAFAHVRRANELRQQIDRTCGVVYDPAAISRGVDRLIATFTRDWFGRVQSAGVDSELPVFIVGMLRSG